jgi:hypothetical protein
MGRAAGVLTLREYCGTYLRATVCQARLTAAGPDRLAGDHTQACPPGPREKAAAADLEMGGRFTYRRAEARAAARQDQGWLTSSSIR